MSPASAWHLGTARCVAAAPSRAVSHPQPRAIPGGVPDTGWCCHFLRGNSVQQGQPRCQGEVLQGRSPARWQEPQRRPWLEARSLAGEGREPP